MAKPYIIIELLGDLSNQVIADIGAGSGYFSFRFVHKSKKVIAVDIEKELVDMMIAEKSYYKQEIQNKFEARLAQADNPNLEDNEIDIAFIANTYPYISNRIQYLKKLRSKFKANGKIMIVDFKKKLTPIGPSQEERLAQSEVEQELIDAGYQLIISDDTTLQYQYIIVAKI
ncbi:MAG: methyltransferase domain-containing protein [Saprospiraceae bacterium]|nr:methyltransferase domain-containing protein [Saprospiraceae bacterium]